MTAEDRPGKVASLPNTQDAVNLLTPEQTRINSLTPIEVAREFVQICKTLDDYYEEEPVNRPYAERIELAEKQREILQELDGLVDARYPGTQIGKKTLIDSFHNPFSSADQVLRESSYGGLISQLGIELDSTDPGVFTKEGAKRYEGLDLRVLLPARIDTLTEAAERYNGHKILQKDAVNFIGRLLVQAGQYKELFGESYDGGNEAVITRRAGFKKYFEEHDGDMSFLQSKIKSDESGEDTRSASLNSVSHRYRGVRTPDILRRRGKPPLGSRLRRW